MRLTEKYMKDVIVANFEGVGEAWTTDESGDTLAWHAVRALTAGEQRIVAFNETHERELLAAAQAAEDAAGGDSNDSEIDALRDAYESAFSVLGIRIPEGRRECEECEELVIDPDAVSYEHDISCSLHSDNVVEPKTL